MLIEAIEFRIEKENWTNGSTWIYRIHPTKPTEGRIKRHPKYKQFSIISNQEFIPGQVITADLKEKKNRKGDINYHFVKEIVTFPKDADSQWSFLARIAGNHSFKRVHKSLIDHLKASDLILDYIIDHPEPPKFMDKKLHDPYRRMRETIERYQTNAQFIEHLPKEVSDLLSDAVIQKLSELDATAEQSARKFIRQPFEAISIEGLGFKTLDKIRDQLFQLYPNQFTYHPSNPVRVYYGAYDVIQNAMINSGNTYIEADELAKQMVNRLELPEADVRHFIERGYENQPNIEGEGLVKIDGVFSTDIICWSEEKNYRYLTEENNFEADDGVLQGAIDAYLEKKGDMLSDEQIHFLQTILDHKIHLLSGGGGTGKTWLVSQLIDIFESVYPGSTILTAPTGKAAQVLSGYTGYEATTIHRAFGISPDVKKIHGGAPGNDKVKLIVFDEASMIDTVLMANIIHGVNALEQPVRLVFIGDPYQLPSVGPGNILHSLLKHEVANITHLTHVYRVGDSQGGIAELSKHLREGYFPYKKSAEPEAFGGDLVLQHLDETEAIQERILTAYLKLLKDGAYPEDIMVLSPQNKGLTGQAELNVAIQTLVRDYYERKQPSYLSRSIHGVETEFFVDDLILFTKNDKYHQFHTIEMALEIPLPESGGGPKEVSVYNGEVGIINELDDRGMIIKVLGGNDTIFVPKDQLSSISLAYALTIHKSQGSQAAYGIMGVSRRDYYSLNANLLYTGVTRFIERLYLFGDFGVMKQKVKTFANLNRQTLLDKWLEADSDGYYF